MLLFHLALVAVELLAILLQKLQNKAETHAAPWQQKLAADLS